MYAIIKTGGKQYIVREGDVLRVEKLDVDEGSEVSFDEVLAINDDESLKVGNPNLAGSKVEAKVIKHGKGKKIVVFKYKPKKNYRKKQGHRQPFTQVHKSGNVSQLMVKGHSGFDDAGKDIVCSGVSAIVQTIILGLTHIVGIEIKYRKKNGLIDFKMPGDLTQDKIKEANILLETALLGLKSIKMGYDEYIDIRERRVE